MERLRQRESAFDVVDQRGLVIENLNNIKPEGDVRHIKHAKPNHGGFDNQPLLFSIHGFGGASKLFVGPGFDLHKNKNFPVPADNIHLPAMRSLKIAAQNFVARIF